ncbi:MAG: NAD-dependent epimerase/dehydratase family protein [Promethearchaeota archaeon]
MAKKMKILITGSCGFIGSNLVKRLLDLDCSIYGIDNLIHLGSESRLKELNKLSEFHFIKADISNRNDIFNIFKNLGSFSSIFHLAAQTAVTTSYNDRILDFNTNALGSFNIIEAVKRYSPKAYCLYTSTNKVYGNICFNKPINKNQPTHPYTPYGISKFVGDLYFNEYRNPEIGLKTCILRQSCIYGPNQYGIEDQGWVAWFVICNLLQKQLTIYGDGKQIRDVLYIDDLMELYEKFFLMNIQGSYPVGGGEGNAIDLVDMLNMIESITGTYFKKIKFTDPRSGDQPYFVADNGWAKEMDFFWEPKVKIRDGLKRLILWVDDNIDNIKKVLDERK